MMFSYRNGCGYVGETQMQTQIQHRMTDQVVRDARDAYEYVHAYDDVDV